VILRPPVRGAPVDTNQALNPYGVGAVVGTIGSGGALPSGWTSLNQGTLTLSVIGFGTDPVLGLPYIDLRWNGTTSTTTSDIVLGTYGTPGPGFMPVVSTGPDTISVYAALVGGALTNVTGEAISADTFTAALGFVNNISSSISAPTASFQRIVATGTPGATAVSASLYAQMQWASASSAVDVTIRFAGFKFEQGRTATSFGTVYFPSRVPVARIPGGRFLVPSPRDFSPPPSPPIGPAAIEWLSPFVDPVRVPRAAQQQQYIAQTQLSTGLSIDWQRSFINPYLVAQMPTAAVLAETHPVLPPSLGIIGWYAPLSTPSAHLVPRALPVAVSSPSFFPGFLPIVPAAPLYSYYEPFGNPPPPLPNRATFMPPATGPPPNYAFDRWFQEALSEPPAYLRRPHLSTAIQQTFTAPITAALPPSPLISNIHPGLAGWSPGPYVLGQRFSSGGNAYQCIQAGNSTVPPVGNGSFIQSVPASGFSSGFSSGWGNPADSAAFKWLSHIDYTSLQAWANDLMTNYSVTGLPAPVTALVWNDSTLTSPLNQEHLAYYGIPNNGVPTLITCAPGESFRDRSGNPLTFNASNGVAFDAPTVGAEQAVAPIFYFDVANVTIDGFQFRDINQTGNSANSGTDAQILIGLNVNAVNFTVQNSILDGFHLLYTPTTNTWLKNCLLVNEQTQQATTGTPLWPIKWDFGATGGAINCTCIGFNPTGTCSMFTTLGGVNQAQLINVASFGIPNPFFCQNTGGSIIVDHCATNLASVTADGATAGSLTNVFGNSTLAGAVAGSPGTLPTGFDATTQANGLAFQVVNTGTDGTTGNTFVDLRMHGTGTGVDCNIYLSGLGGTATQPTTNYTMSIGLAIVGGSTANLAGIALASNNLDSGHNFISGAVFDGLTLTASLSTFTTSFATTGTNAFNSFGIDLETPTNGQPVDITLRIEFPQLLTSSGSGSVVGLSIANQFISAANDFRLKASSGLIDRGRADLADLPSGQDIYRTLRPQGLGWDIGAVEFVFSLVWLGALPQPGLRPAGLPVALRTQEPPFISIQRAEVTSLDRWFHPLSRPLPPPLGLRQHLQHARAAPVTVGTPEATSLDRWAPTYPAIVRGVFIHPSVVPSHAEPVSPIFVQDVSRLQWNASWPRSVPGRSVHPSQVPFAAVLPISPVFREATTLDRWYRALSVPQLWRVYYREQALPTEPFVPIKIVPIALNVSPLAGGVLVTGYGPLIKRLPGS